MTFDEWMKENIHNPDEAPEGYIAVKKKDFDRPNNLTDNYCNHCDWRKECTPKVCSCMSYSRKDEISVVFKHK